MKRLIAFILAVLMCLSFTACTAKSALTGTWKTDVTIVGENVPEGDNYGFLTFKDNGKCTYISYVNNNEYSTDIEYTATDSQLTMRYEGRERVCEYFIDGDRLTLIYNGDSQVLHRVKEG